MSESQKREKAFSFYAKNLLEGEVAVITGGGTGIGYACAAAFAELGAKVVLTSRKLENLELAAEKIKKETQKEALPIACDVRKEEEVKALMQKTKEHFGKLSILVNNAAGNFRCETEKLSSGGWKAVTGIVLDGTFFCSREAFPYLKESQGNILNIVAAYAWTGNPRTAPSASAKAGVDTLTKTLAVEWAPHGIRVNALAPGATETEGPKRALWGNPGEYDRIQNRVPLRRFAEPREIALAAVFLVSRLGAYVTGETLVVDGGLWLV